MLPIYYLPSPWFVTMGQWRKVGTERPLCVCFGKEMIVITKATIRGEWGQGYMVSHSRELHTPTLQNIKRFSWLLLLKNVCPFPVGQQSRADQTEWLACTIWMELHFTLGGGRWSSEPDSLLPGSWLCYYYMTVSSLWPCEGHLQRSVIHSFLLHLISTLNSCVCDYAHNNIIIPSSLLHWYCPMYPLPFILFRGKRGNYTLFTPISKCDPFRWIANLIPSSSWSRTNDLDYAER